MDKITIERRLELLRLEGNGLEPSEIVKELSSKHGVSERMVYKDLETRNTWQPELQEMQKALLKVRNRHEQLYRARLPWSKIAYASSTKMLNLHSSSLV